MMQKLDLRNIPLQDRKKLFIVEEDIDRLVLEISALSKKKKEMADCQLLTVDEYKMFSRDTYQIGDILLWDDYKKSYIIWDDYLENSEANILSKFRHFLMVDLQAKNISLNIASKEEVEINWDVSFGVDGNIKKITAEANANFDRIKKRLASVAANIKFNEGHKKRRGVDFDEVEKTLKKTGLINIENFSNALDTCRRGGRTEAKYVFFQQTENQIHASANVGFKLANFLGIKAFSKWNYLSKSKISASFSYNIEF